MDSINKIFIQWNSLKLLHLYFYPACGTFLIIFIIEAFCVNNKKIRTISIFKIFFYIKMILLNFAILLIFLHYYSILFIIIYTICLGKCCENELIRLREMGLQGGCYGYEKQRKQQIEEFKLKTNEEQEKIIEYYINYSTKLNPNLLALIILIPLLIVMLIIGISRIGL